MTVLYQLCKQVVNFEGDNKNQSPRSVTMKIKLNQVKPKTIMYVIGWIVM